MDDDLDELLDEVESKFCQDVTIRPSAHSHTNPVKSVTCDKESEGKKTHRSDTEDIDALLDELLDEDYDSSHPKTGQLSKGLEARSKKPLPQIGGKKCCPVFLGGSSITNGIGTAISKRSCDQLRCTSCDFRVLLFDDYAWDASCDYLFLRNNMPDSQKLRAKLKRKRGTRAYACQCSWFSSEDLADLRDQTQLKWVCGTHDT